MTISDEMQRLTEHFLDAYDNRMQAVADIRTATAEELNEFQAAHQEMAAELRTHLEGRESERMAQAAEDARGRAEYVAALKADTAAMLSDFERDRAQMASEVTAMRGGFQAAHQEMAAELRARLEEQESERRAQAAEDARGRAEYVAAMRGELQADLSEARRVWGNFATQMRGRRSGRPAARRSVKKEVARSREVVGEGVTRDDLTAIRGIGLGMQSRLNEAGIYTYAQLAARAAEELRQALGVAARLANVEEWLAQARELGGGS